MGRFIFGGAPFQPPDGVTITYNDTNQIQTSGVIAAAVDGTTIILNGSNKIAVNLANPNTWTALQTFGTSISMMGEQVSGSTASQGSFLYDNGTNWVRLPLTAGTGITITNTATSVTIASTSSVQVDNTTIELNSSEQLAVKPSVVSQTGSYPDITYSANTTLTGNVLATNVTIDSGVTVTTNGYAFIVESTFTNNGTINTGSIAGGGSGAAGASYTSSYGGSGGGGGGSTYFVGGAGGSTTVAGGAGGSTTPTAGSNGSTATAPALSSSLINTWYSNGFSNYLNGGSGGGGAGNSANSSGGGGGNSAYGLYIQADTLVAGSIVASGGSGSNDTTYGGGGGGGGGSILLAYGSGGLTAGTYSVAGGIGGTPTSSTGGGNGGNGLIMTFSGLPISTPAFMFSTAANSIKNRISSYNYTADTTTSTSNVVTASQTITPKTSGLVAIRATVIINNNTVGDGVAVFLYNGSTQLDTSTYTQEGLAGNNHTVTLYSEQLFTSPFAAQTYTVQYAAITGGTASCEIQEFTTEEEY